MKPKKILGYVCVTILMAISGFLMGIGLGGLTDLTFHYFADAPLTGRYAATIGLIMSIMLTLSVYVENPIAVVLNKYMQWEEEYKSSIPKTKENKPEG